jgi:hypothetical protein
MKIIAAGPPACWPGITEVAEGQRIGISVDQALSA